MDHIFLGCSQLNDINIVSGEIKRIEYFEDQFLVYKKNPKSDQFDTLLWVKPSIQTAKIPSFIKTIASCAFSECSSLKEITLSNSITKIEDYAFSGCK